MKHVDPYEDSWSSNDPDPRKRPASDEERQWYDETLGGGVWHRSQRWSCTDGGRGTAPETTDERKVFPAAGSGGPSSPAPARSPSVEDHCRAPNERKS